MKPRYTDGRWFSFTKRIKPVRYKKGTEYEIDNDVISGFRDHNNSDVFTDGCCGTIMFTNTNDIKLIELTPIIAKEFYNFFYRNSNGSWEIKDTGYLEFALRNGYEPRLVELLDEIEELFDNDDNEEKE